MTHYAHVLCFNRLKFDVNLGFYDDERAGLQPVEVSMRLYFPEAPKATTDDEGQFFDYAPLCVAITELLTSKPYRLVEYMATEVFKLARAFVDERGGADIKIWVLFTKCTPPVQHLEGGASFIYSDLPPGSTTIYSPVL